MVSSEMSKIVTFFVGLSLAAATLDKLKDAGITLQDVLDSYQAAASVAVFIAAMVDVVGGGVKVDYLRMCNFMAQNASSVASAAAPEGFVDAVVAAALEDGADAESVRIAAKAHIDTNDGKWQLVKHCMLYGTEMLRLAEHDEGAGKKLKTAKLSKGGEWTTHLTTRSDWDIFVNDVIEYLMEEKGSEHVAAVTRLQRFQVNIPAWHQGGKLYVKEYLKKHSCNFPKEVDVVLLVRCQAASSANIEKQLGQLEEVSGVATRMKSLEEQVRLLKAGNAGGGNDGAGGNGGGGWGTFVPYARRRCLKCMTLGHMAADCRRSVEEAARMKQEYYDNLRSSGGDGDGGAGANPPTDGGAPAGGDGGN